MSLRSVLFRIVLQGLYPCSRGAGELFRPEAARPLVMDSVPVGEALFISSRSHRPFKLGRVAHATGATVVAAVAAQPDAL